MSEDDKPLGPIGYAYNELVLALVERKKQGDNWAEVLLFRLYETEIEEYVFEKE